jgi:hypothetical protein
MSSNDHLTWIWTGLYGRDYHVFASYDSFDIIQPVYQAECKWQAKWKAEMHREHFVPDPLPEFSLPNTVAWQSVDGAITFSSDVPANNVKISVVY